MDVRCERCRAQYTFQDDQLTPEGVTVQCTACGHVFLIKKKELVVTYPVKVEEPRVARPPPPPEPVPAAPSHHWTIRQASGQTLSFSELNTLQRWIVERKVARQDEVTQGDGVWIRLGTLGELKPFFDVVDAADRAQGRPTSRHSTDPYLPPTWVPQAAAPPAPVPPPPGPERTPAYELPPLPREPAPGAASREPGGADLPAAGRSSRTRNLLLAVLLLVVAGAAAYVLVPALPGRVPPAPPAAAPLAVKPPEPAPEPRPPPPEPRPEPKSEPMPEPKPEPQPEVKSPEPVPEPAAVKPPPTPTPEARPRPPGTRKQLAEARRLREGSKAGQALEVYGRVLAAEPDNAEALAGRGLCYLDLDQYPPAEASLQAALRVSPTQPDALLGLAETYRTLGRKPEAIAMFERYLSAHPGGDEADVARNAINQLKE